MGLLKDFFEFTDGPAKRCAFVFRQKMQPCPKCGGYNLKYQAPIRIDDPLPDDLDARKMLGIWARARKKGATPLKGPVYLMCFDCFHKGPSVDCSGRTSEDVSCDPIVNTEVKRMWNEQKKIEEKHG